MSFVVVPDKSVGDTFTEAMWDTYIKDNLNKGVIRPIAETTLVASAASIDFTSIAADWSHLLLVGYLRTDSAFPDLRCRFNGDTGANYDYQRILADNASISTAGSAGATAATFSDTLCGSDAVANVFSPAILWIPHYANATNHKSGLGWSSRKTANTSAGMAEALTAIFWRSGAAINQVTVLPNSGNFVSGCRVTLYGLGGS